MASIQRLNVYVTYVEKEGPFLKLWGQTDKTKAIFVEQFLSEAAPQFDLGAGKVSPEYLIPGTLVCARYKDNKYYRAKILHAYVREGFLEVSFIDFGNKETVSCEEIRSLQSFSTPVASIGPLATGFIFAEAHCVGGGEWNDMIFESIAKEMKYREVQCTLLAQATNHYLVRISIEGTDISNLFIQRGLMQPISLQAQQAVLLSMSMQKPTTPHPPETNPASAGINTFKACTLEPGQQYPVYVSYVNDGPCHFSVQLKKTEDVLVKLMNEINHIELRILEETPIPGTICLATCQEDNNICRAVVTTEVDTQFRVFYVDFGNYEVLPADCLHQIPFKYVLPKVMAIRFSLAGVENSTVTKDMKKAFKKFVDNRLLHMKVLPSPTRIALPKCELWDPETNTSALEVVMNAAKHSYPEPVALTRGFSQPVKISFVYSCNRFYVQLVSKENDLISLMENLQELCQSDTFMEPSSIKPEVPCCALFQGDGLWYRSQVVEVVGNEAKVRYIDYGNEESVPISQLKDIDGEILTVLRPQAIECCLNGYQKMEPDEVRDGLLEELILERIFTMKVVEMSDKKALVDLFDDSNYNVASLLLDKLAAANSQISPVLAVQAGNKLEHRKSYSQQREQNFKDKSYNTGREQKSWDKPSDRNEKHWRQDSRDNRNFDKNTNENNETNSWRQNNKGFSPNSRLEKYKNQDDTWNNNENKSNNDSNWNAPAPADDWKDSNNTNTQGNSGWGDGSYDGRNRKNDGYKSNRGGFNDRGGRGGYSNNRDRGDRGGFNTERDRGDRGGFNAERDRGDRGGFNTERDRGGFNNDRDRGERGGFRNDRGGRGDNKFGGKSRDGGYRQREFKKDSSEISSSGSEKSFHRGPRTSSRADHGGRGGKTFDKPRNSFKDYSSTGGGGDNWETVTSTEDSWNVSTVASTIDAASAAATFVNYEIVGSESRVMISWFHNPGLFYCQLLNDQEQFKTMMEEIHDFYKDRKPEKVVLGSPVIGLFPEDNVLYRARVVDVIGNEYKVQYVDYGNVSTVSKVWPIDKKFMNLPAQAITCCLNNVAPPGEQWGDPDCYSNYFDKESFVCNFVNKDEEKTFVNLVHDSEDVAQLLVRDGLAISTASTVPDIEIPLLLGQQFRAIVKSVNNLSDIILALECGLAVSCTMHNLETATETFEETLKGLLEQTVIVYVDNILEDYRLEITLYDTQGNKHVIINPDEGSYDTVDIPCPLLVLYSTINGYVTFADETSIFIQPTEVAEQVTTLLDQLFETYDEKPHENTIIPEEGMIYAVHSEDGNWYRGKVISFDDEKATVCYVDYGNSESVAFSELRELEVQFLDVSILNLQITVTSGADMFVDKDVSACIYYGEAGWEGTVQIINTQTETAPANSTDTGFASNSIDKPEELSSDIQEVEISNEIVETETVVEDENDKTEKIAATIGTSVVVSHIDSPCDFYLQFNENLEDIDNLQGELQEKVEEMEVLVNPAPGVLCAAPYSLDQMWYRAEVLDADEDITTVRFVDFGNTDVIDNKTTQIRTLSPKLLSLAIYATRCSLKIEPVEEDWSPLAQGVFETLTGEGDLTAEFCNQDEKCTYVELYANGINIRNALVLENLAKPITTTVKTKQTGFVSHFNSPSEFWIQFESCVDELEWIAEQLSSAENFPDLTDLTPGTLCAALFPDDQMWYRARILSNTVAGIELLFIDYGNSCTSTDLKQLPEDLIMTAPLAMKCSLQKNEGIPTWTSEAAAKFAEISADGQTIFTVKKISTGETSVVQLYLDDKDVTTMLLPTTEDGHVKEIESLENLTIKKENGGTIENVALQPMEGQKLGEEAKEKLEELNEQGSTVFQIEFVNEKTVRLYLQGKDVRPLLGGFISPAFNPLLNEEQNLTIVENTAGENGYEEEDKEFAHEDENKESISNVECTDYSEEKGQTKQDNQTMPTETESNAENISSPEKISVITEPSGSEKSDIHESEHATEEPVINEEEAGNEENISSSEKLSVITVPSESEKSDIHESPHVTEEPIIIEEAGNEENISSLEKLSVITESSGYENPDTDPRESEHTTEKTVIQAQAGSSEKLNESTEEKNQSKLEALCTNDNEPENSRTEQETKTCEESSISCQIETVDNIENESGTDIIKQIVEEVQVQLFEAVDRLEEINNLKKETCSETVSSEFEVHAEKKDNFEEQPDITLQQLECSEETKDDEKGFTTQQEPERESEKTDLSEEIDPNKEKKIETVEDVTSEHLSAVNEERNVGTGTVDDTNITNQIQETDGMSMTKNPEGSDEDGNTESTEIVANSDGSAVSLDDIVKEHVMTESLAALHNENEVVDSTETESEINVKPEKGEEEEEKCKTTDKDELTVDKSEKTNEIVGQNKIENIKNESGDEVIDPVIENVEKDENIEKHSTSNEDELKIEKSKECTETVPLVQNIIEHTKNKKDIDATNKQKDGPATSTGNKTKVNTPIKKSATNVTGGKNKPNKTVAKTSPPTQTKSKIDTKTTPAKSTTLRTKLLPKDLSSKKEKASQPKK